MIDPMNLLSTVFQMLTGDHVVVAALLVLVGALAFGVKWIWGKYDALRAEAANQIKELQESLAELNTNYSEANNRAADTIAKIGDALLKLADLTAKK